MTTEKMEINDDYEDKAVSSNNGGGMIDIVKRASPNASPNVSPKALKSPVAKKTSSPGKSPR